VEGISRLRDFLRIGLAGLEEFWGGYSHSLGFHEDWISSIKILCGRFSQAYIGISWEEA
jgi:hypothetical protein